jgi:hypothetical protein
VSFVFFSLPAVAVVRYRYNRSRATVHQSRLHAQTSTEPQMQGNLLKAMVIARIVGRLVNI